MESNNVEIILNKNILIYSYSCSYQITKIDITIYW